MFRFSYHQCISCSRAQHGFLLLVAVIFLTTPANCLLDEKGKINPMSYCGIALDEILDSLCVHGYTHRLRRSVQLTKDNLHAQHMPDEQHVVNQDVPTKRRRNLRRFRRSARHRRWSNIINECCKHGCVYADLSNYCKTAPDT